MLARVLGLSMLLILAQGSSALVTCAPTDCNPGCNSSCTYQRCEQSAKQHIATKSIPYKYVPQSDACEAPGEQDIKKLPVTLSSSAGSITFKSVNLTGDVPIKICESFTKNGPPCPPPPSPSP